jgi:hypothetical protein
MNPVTSVKLSAIFFAAFWSAGMVWWSGTFDLANIVITAIFGAIAGYLWYLAMRWVLVVRQVPAGEPSSWLGRKTASVLTNRWTEWTMVMVLAGLATAELRGYADPAIPAGEWHGFLSGAFVVVVYPCLTWSFWTFLKRYPQGLVSLLFGRWGEITQK